MERTERFYKIEMLIRSRGSVSFIDLMAELGVSRATLKRDLDHLRTRMDAPIVYDRDSNGYCLKNRPGRSVQAAPGRAWFTDRELHALLTMHILIDSLGTDGTLGRHLQPMQERLQAMLGTSEVEARELLKRVRIDSPLPEATGGRYFEQVGRALTERRRLHLQVRSGDADAEPRLVSPQRLLQLRQRWWLDAWCHESRQLVRIALDQIDAAEIVDLRARDVAMRSLQVTLDAGAADTEAVDAADARELMRG